MFRHDHYRYIFLKHFDNTSTWNVTAQSLLLQITAFEGSPANTHNKGISLANKDRGNCIHCFLWKLNTESIETELLTKDFVIYWDQMRYRYFNKLGSSARNNLFLGRLLNIIFEIVLLFGNHCSYKYRAGSFLKHNFEK